MRLFLVLVVSAFGLLGSARADTINTFNLTATLSSGSASGTVSLNQTTGFITAANISVTTVLGSATYTGAPVSSSSGTGYTSNVFSMVNSPYTFDLVLPLTSLKNYTGGALCTMASLCSGRESGVELAGIDVNAVTSGTLALAPATAVTPEPPGLLLLGAGVLALGAMLKRRSA